VLVPGNARLYHALTAHHGKIELVSSLVCQCLYEDALCAPVAFAERVHGVEIDHHIGSAAGEFLPCQAAQMVPASQSSRDAVKPLGNPWAFHELVKCEAVGFLPNRARLAPSWQAGETA
jgi:hypothetical protein